LVGNFEGIKEGNPVRTSNLHEPTGKEMFYMWEDLS